MPLTNIACHNARPGPTLRKLSDGGNLQLWVRPNGAKTWRFAYRFGGKQKSLSLGPYPLITLADARKARDDAKRHLVSMAKTRRLARLLFRCGARAEPQLPASHVRRLEQILRERLIESERGPSESR